jgi:hypothetical protein
VTYLSADELERYAASYRRSNDFVKHCCEAVSTVDASPQLLDQIVTEYGVDVLADAISAGDWLIGEPWRKSGLRPDAFADVIRLDDHRTATTNEGPPAA